MPAQEFELLAGLDALGDHLEVEALAHVDDGSHDGGIVRIDRDVAHERLVDLQSADRELLQGGKRRIAGAEIVDRQIEAHRIQLVQQPDGPFRVGHQGRLRHLELEAGRGHVMAAEDVPASGDEARLFQLAQRQIDGDAARLRHRPLPLAIIGADAVHHPLADVQDEAGFLGQRYELGGRDVAVPRQAPAQQRLGADHAAVAQVHLGLIQNDEFVALQGAAQLALQHQALDRRRIHVRNVERTRIAAILFRVVHGRIGVADQVDDVLRVVGADGDADAGREVDLLLVHVERPADLVQQRARERGQRRAVVDIDGQIVDEHRELVAGEAADDRVLAQIPGQPLAQYLERPIAGRVAEGVVDLLEAVEIEVEQRERPLVAPRAGDGLLEQMLKLHAIRHLGEGVVARQIADAALRPLALGDVPSDVDIALELRVFRGDARIGHGDRYGLAGRRPQHGLARLGRRRGGVEGAAMGLVDEAGHRLAHEFGLRMAEQPLSRLIAALHDAVRRGDQHRVAQAVEHGVEVVLGNGGFRQILPHALERHLQFTDLVLAHHRQRPAVVALADAVGRLHQRGNGPRQLAPDEPGADQAEHDQRQHHAGDQTAHSLDLVTLAVLHLRLNADQGVLHLGAVEPDLEGAAGLQHGVLGRNRALEHERPPSGRILDFVAAREEHHAAGVPDLHPLDVMFLEQPLGDARHRRFAGRSHGGAEQRDRNLAQRSGAGLEIRFELLLNGGVGELVDVGGVDPMLVIGDAGQQQREHRPDRQGGQGILGFEAASHRCLCLPANSLHPGMIPVHIHGHKGPGRMMDYVRPDPH